LFNKTFGCVRFYWNNLVDSFNSYDKDANTSPKYKTQKELKVDYNWLKEVSATALQQKYNDFIETKNQYFKKDRKIKLGRMKFKKKGGDQSYRLPNPRFSIVSNKIKLEKIGLVSIVIDRHIPINSKLLSVTVSKNPSGQYFASINFQVEQELKQKTSNENVGIDLGVSAIATLSNGMQFDNPKRFAKNQSKLRSCQKHLSRKVKGSNRYNKQKIKVAKLHQKITNQRDWQLHNISKYIVENFNEIGMEDLNIKGMVKNRKLSKAISDTSMSKLKQFISYKQKEYGKKVILLGRFQPSTKECSYCGNVQKMNLSDRIFECVSCGFKLNRDYQAAIVIRNKTVGVNADKRSWSESKTLHPLVVVKQLHGSDYHNIEHSSIK
jgi:putative transposase